MCAATDVIAQDRGWQPPCQLVLGVELLRREEVADVRWWCRRARRRRLCGRVVGLHARALCVVRLTRLLDDELVAGTVGHGGTGTSGRAQEQSHLAVKKYSHYADVILGATRINREAQWYAAPSRL